MAAYPTSSRKARTRTTRRKAASKRKAVEVTDNNPDGLRTVRSNGEAPKSRVRRASQVLQICRDLVESDVRRMAKRERIWKAYKRFPPTDYSTLVELKMEDQSNVCWGMLAFAVNNTRGSFYDMIVERGRACDIQTKVGTVIQQRVYSDLISEKYDEYGVREDFDYLIGQEISILDMCLFGKGIHMWEDVEGHVSEAVPARDFYVPEDTHIALSKFDLFMRKRKFQLYELYERIENESAAKERGWNTDAVAEAMRMQREDWLSNYTSEDFMHDIVNGNMAMTSVMKESVHVYDFYIREFDGTISRMMILQDYTALVNEKSNPASEGVEAHQALEDDVVDECGFLLCKMEYAKAVNEVVCVFLDNAGSGEWHDTPSLAEEIFVQCRQYDIIMNSIMDAVKLNMTLMLQGQTADATERLKQMVWGQFAVIPADTPFVQQRTQLDTQEATTTLQFMMSDLYSGIGRYQVGANSPNGEAPTATQSQQDAAESAKLSGTQTRRYNEQQTVYHRERFRRFIALTKGAKGYEQFEKFKDDLKEAGVPEKAWSWENIRSVTSNMIAGPGSPSYKMQAADKIIAITNMTPKDDGQRAAFEDAIAAVAGRSNVSRYMPPKERLDPDNEEWKMGLECEAFSDPNLNPKNVVVKPDDPHIQHISYHLDDMAQTIMGLQDAMQKGQLDEKRAFPGMTRLMHQGAHVTAHMQFLARDTGKQPILKKFSADLNIIQKQIGQLQQQMQKMLDDKKNQGSQLDPNDPDIMKKMSMAQIDIEAAQQLAQIKAQAAATMHNIHEQAAQDKATTDVAITRAKAAAAIQAAAAVGSYKPAATPPAIPTV